jgi:hypothetical protein
MFILLWEWVWRLQFGLIGQLEAALFLLLLFNWIYVLCIYNYGCG